MALLGAVFGAWGAVFVTVLAYGLQAATPRTGWNIIEPAVSTAFFLPLAALPVMLATFLGHLMLVVTGLTGAAAYAALGVIIGAGCASLVGLPPCPPGTASFECLIWGWTDVAGLGALPGAMGALAFWLVARPDQGTA